jgi:hypothetical protein
MAVAPALYRNVRYDPIKSFAPVVMIARSHQILIVNPAVPAKSVQELVAYAKGNPGKVHFGSPASEPEWLRTYRTTTGSRCWKNGSPLLEKRVGLVAAQDRINLRSPVDDSKISEVIR